MSPQNIATVAIVAFIALIYILGVAIGQSMSKRRRFYRSDRYGPKRVSAPTDAGQQLQAVARASFEKRRLLSPSEYRVFKVIEKDVADARKGYRVFAQTNLGEILASSDEAAFHSINSKRVDILIVDQGGWPVAAIEYQGHGHHQGTAAQRDAIKREALGKAGIRYIEIEPADSADAIRYRIREQLGWINPEMAKAKVAELIVPARTTFGQRGAVPARAGA